MIYKENKKFRKMFIVTEYAALKQVQFRYVKKKKILKIIKTVSVFVLKTTCLNWWVTGGFEYKTYDKDGYSGVCVQNVFITIAN